MSKDYIVIGIHCDDCDKDLEKKLQTLSQDSMAYNPKDNRLTIKDPKYYDNAKILVQSHGAYLVEDTVDLTHQHAAGVHDHHDHGHHHDHGASGTNIGIAFFLNFGFSIAEFIFGSIFNSYAILSDAVHDLGDSLSIGVAWVLEKLASREPDMKFTDGYGRFSLLGSLITGLVLVMGSVMMIIRSVPRLINPEPVNYQGMFWMAVIAIAINAYAWYLMSRGATKNERMLSLHMLEDVLGWIAVLIVAFVLRFKDWFILDPILSIAIALFLLYKTLPELFNSLKIFMNIVPENLDLPHLEEAILAIDHVHQLSNLHFHSIDGQDHHFSVILYVNTEDVKEIEAIKSQVREKLAPYHVVSCIIEVVPDVNFIATE